MAGVGKPTFKMREALAAQDLIESLEMRRTLRDGLEGARRRFNVWLTDESLGLSGKVDLLLDSPTEAAVVDYLMLGLPLPCRRCRCQPTLGRALSIRWQAGLLRVRLYRSGGFGGGWEFQAGRSH